MLGLSKTKMLMKEQARVKVGVQNANNPSMIKKDKVIKSCILFQSDKKQTRFKVGVQNVNFPSMS